MILEIHRHVLHALSCTCCVQVAKCAYSTPCNTITFWSIKHANSLPHMQCWHRSKKKKILRRKSARLYSFGATWKCAFNRAHFYNLSQMHGIIFTIPICWVWAFVACSGVDRKYLRIPEHYMWEWEKLFWTATCKIWFVCSWCFCICIFWQWNMCFNIYFSNVNGNLMFGKDTTLMEIFCNKI